MNCVTSQLQDDKRHAGREYGSTSSPLVSKSALPLEPASLLPLARLEQQLSPALARRVTAIVAPAGYGKSMLLARLYTLARAQRYRTAWIRVDREDNDMLQFLRYLSSALGDMPPGLRDSNPPGPDSRGAHAAAVAATLLAELARAKLDTAIFIDDYHLIENEEIHRLVERIVAHSAANVRILVASRAAPPLGLSKLRLTQQLYEFGADELRLRPQEAAQLLAAICQRDLNADQLGQLYKLTEGWPVGLTLAACALRGVADPSRFVKEFGGTDRDIASYLGETVMQALPAAVMRFLEVTSLFDRFSAALCREVLGETDAAHTIEWIREHNVFVVPLDRQNQWFRYHPLLATYLRARFCSGHPEDSARIYSRASIWFARSGCTGEAIHYAMAAADYERAADLISGYAAQCSQLRGDHDDLLAWVAALPASHLQQRLDIKLPWIHGLIYARRFKQAEAELKNIRADIDGGNMALTGNMGQQDAIAKVVALQCALHAMADQSERAAEIGRNWLAQARDVSLGDVGVVYGALGYRALRTCQYAEADRFFVLQRMALERCDYGGVGVGAGWPDLWRVLIEFERGNLIDGERAITYLRHASPADRGPSPFVSHALNMMQARVCLEKNQLTTAAQLLEGSFECAVGQGPLELAFVAFTTRARLAIAVGDYPGADRCLYEGQERAVRWSLPRLALMLNAERVQCLLQSGQVERAVAIGRAMGIADDTMMPQAPDGEDLALQLTALRLQLATNNDGMMPKLLRQALSQAQRQSRHGYALQIHCLKALFLVRRGAHREALRTLREALAIGKLAGYLRSLVDEHPQLPPLLQEILEHQFNDAVGDAGRRVPPDYLAQLLDMVGGVPAAAQLPQAPANNIDALSEREIQILSLLDSGLGNRELAARLFLSEATVKWHLHKIYTKLGVRSRTAALVRARELAILPGATRANRLPPPASGLRE